MQNQPGINDDELNQMIASLKQQKQPNAAPAPVAPAAESTPAPATSNSGIQGLQTMGGEDPASSDKPVDAPPAPITTLNKAPNGPTVIKPPVKSASSVIDEVNRELASQNGETSAGAPSAVDVSSNPMGGSSLESIKKQAISELRPLVGKLNLPPADKFDTLLLLIRTTDDQTLIPAAHNAAMAIPDESRRAQALLDIIKEIDFFGSKK